MSVRALATTSLASLDGVFNDLEEPINNLRLLMVRRRPAAAYRQPVHSRKSLFPLLRGVHSLLADGTLFCRDYQTEALGILARLHVARLQLLTLIAISAGGMRRHWSM